MERTGVHEVVHTLRQKPRHVRENIAVGVAGGVTLVVALGWLVGNSVSGTFVLAPKAVAVDAAQVAQSAAPAQNNFSQLIGAAGAALGATSSAAHITVVDSQTARQVPQDLNDTDQTVIHF